MKRSHRLKPIVEIAKKESAEALNLVSQANTTLRQAEIQLDDLHHYKQEYLARFRQDSVNAMSAQKVLDFRAFLVQLDQAIASQQQLVKRHAEHLTQQQQAWQQIRKKEQSMNTLVDRYRQEEVRDELKQEQRDSDERTTSLWHFRSK